MLIQFNNQTILTNCLTYLFKTYIGAVDYLYPLKNTNLLHVSFYIDRFVLLLAVFRHGSTKIIEGFVGSCCIFEL